MKRNVFTRMREAAETTLDIDIDEKTAARFAGIGTRTWRRLEAGEIFTPPGTIELFWINVHRHDDTSDTFEEFFAAADADATTWKQAYKEEKERTRA